MSFVIVYNNPDKRTIPHYSLTGIIGSDGLLYWLCRDVAKVLGKSRWFGHRLSNIKVQNVIGTLDNVPPAFSRKRIIHHEHLTELLKNAKRARVREFGRKLNSPKTQIAVNPGRSITDFQDPTQLIILNTEENINSFFVWLAMFKERVAETLYCQMSVLDDDFIQSFCKYAEGPKMQKTIAKSPPTFILYEYKGRFVKYVPET